MIIANWKMNGSVNKLEIWLNGINEILSKELQSDCIFCPPACFLPLASKIIKNLDLSISLGAQDLDPDLDNSFTGGINASMLKEFNTKYVIIGHSERRRINEEGDSLLSKKIDSAISRDLRIIFCVGETLEEKNQGMTKKALKKQLWLINQYPMDKTMIAYEPIWAIGSGKKPELEDINNIHNFIVEELNLSKKDFLGVSYGGSITSSSAKSILSLKQVAGLLVGGSSLDYEEFCNIAMSS